MRDNSTKAAMKKNEWLNEIRGMKQSLVRMGSDCICITTTYGIHVVQLLEVVRIKADRSYCTLHFDDKKTLTISKSLKEMLRSLPENRFVRVHASHAINMDHLKLYDLSDGGSALLSDGARLPVSRRRKKEFLQSIRMHCFSKR